MKHRSRGGDDPLILAPWKIARYCSHESWPQDCSLPEIKVSDVSAVFLFRLKEIVFYMMTVERKKTGGVRMT